jgi:alkanesulfonate monooxygenase SsuD/methylene tetrahydromethanopterin reductase-like flavin-dependent oxidoreductase (luciferase family)
VRGGIGLPAAVPGTDMTTLGQWAADSERAEFAAVGVIDRLFYDNLEPLTALAAAAARTARVELFTTVLNVGWRKNPILLAKQMASVEQISGGRLTAGLGLGGWPEDRARDGWPPLVGLSILQEGTAAVRKAWAEAGRPGQPRIVTGRYFSLGDHANAIADEYVRHYYGDEFFPTARADTLTTAEDLRVQLEALRAAGTIDVVLYPASGGSNRSTCLPKLSRRPKSPQPPIMEAGIDARCRAQLDTRRTSHGGLA